MNKDPRSEINITAGRSIKKQTEIYKGKITLK